MIYEPAEDSFLLAEQIKFFAKNKKILDMGTGSGILAQEAKKSGAKEVLAADINKESKDFLKNKKIKFIHSNLFSNTKGKFDLIIFNPPYLPLDKREDVKSSLITAGGRKGDEIIIEFLKQSKKHLNKKGIILIVLSSLTPKKRINQLIRKNTMAKKVLAKKSFFMETLEVWKIFNK